MLDNLDKEETKGSDFPEKQETTMERIIEGKEGNGKRKINEDELWKETRKDNKER